VRDHLDHEVKSWLTGPEYLAAIAAAQDGDRTLSGYVRHLVRTDLALRASAGAVDVARDDLGPVRGDGGRRELAHG